MLTDEIAGLRRLNSEQALTASETISAHRSAITSQAATIQRLQTELTEVRRQLRTRPATPTPRAVPQSNRQGTGEWRTATASWYGPGFYGRRTSNGTVLTEGMMNVAGHGLPFGTMIEFRFNGKTAVAELNDRGPWVPNGRGGWNPHPIRKWDLGPGTATKLGFSGVQRVEYRLRETQQVRHSTRLSGNTRRRSHVEAQEGHTEWNSDHQEVRWQTRQADL